MARTKKKELSSPQAHTHTESQREKKKERSHLCLARNPHSKGPAFTQLKLNLGLTSDMVRAVVVVVVVGSYILRADWVTRSGDRTWAGVCGGMGGCRRGKTRCCASQ